ncbi:DNA cytosine methyltransferase [Phascolarctobacterium faecium]|uniref:DNA cytosine methyltransferase n=1 Tax=Phascolarctobacterium faecium TaxID=33025 RepID=UPI003AF023D4
MNIKTVGSICSGIEAASVAWEPLGLNFEWFSEIADFPSRLLTLKYPDITNLGDMNDIPDKIHEGTIDAPDLLCGGTPCQAFSLAGWKNGLNDDRGNLTLKFVDIVEENDAIRKREGKAQSIVFWENVEGVLTDKTNAFGCLISSLAGFSDVINMKKWSSSGIVHGPKRNVAWRVLDAKYFGVAQQRKRLYLLAGGTDFYPESVLFEEHTGSFQEYPSTPLVFEKEGHQFEVFREYSDCLYSAYGTKWNGNAAAYNGSLFVVQDNRIRRLSPLECERLMGFPDNYTDLQKAKRTNRYQAIGNSWAVPVVHWIGERLVNYTGQTFYLDITSLALSGKTTVVENEGFFIDCGKDTLALSNGIVMNCTPIPENCTFADMSSVVSSDAPEEIYISPVGCYGIVRRKQERNLRINQRLEEVLLNISSQMTPEEIEKRSRVQKRGRFSEPQADDDTTTKVFIPFPQEVKQKEKTELEQQEARQMSIFNFV